MLVVKIILVILAIIICSSLILIAMLTFSSSRSGYLSHHEAKAQRDAILEYHKRRKQKQMKKVDNTLESTFMS
jgi:hypothetical protein